MIAFVTNPLSAVLLFEVVRVRVLRLCGSRGQHQAGRLRPLHLLHADGAERGVGRLRPEPAAAEAHAAAWVLPSPATESRIDFFREFSMKNNDFFEFVHDFSKIMKMWGIAASSSPAR